VIDPVRLRALRCALSHLAAARAQWAPSDDQIIAGHIRDAYALLDMALEGINDETGGE